MLVLRMPPGDPDLAIVARAATVLRDGGLVIYPTDTFYGLAADPRRDDAVDRLFQVKGRDATMATPVIASSVEQVRAAAEVDDRAERLARDFWPGPLTLVLPARQGLSQRAVGANGTVAIRVPDHAIARALAESLSFCITATSANRSGQPASATGDRAAAVFGETVECLIDAGPTPGNLPSTIVDMTAEGPRLIRAGAVAWERVLKSLK
jgi:L-threonylcarbamoyladenylate synthase